MGIDPYGVKRKILRFARHFAGAKTKPCTITPIRPARGCFRFGGWVDVGIDPYGVKRATRRFFDLHTIFQYRLQGRTTLSAAFPCPACRFLAAK